MIALMFKSYIFDVVIKVRDIYLVLSPLAQSSLMSWNFLNEGGGGGVLLC